MWQFSEAVIALVDGCTALGTPVTGGNVSFYNQTGGTNIIPTPVVGVLGVIDDVADRVPLGFAHSGDAIFLLGETREAPWREPRAACGAIVGALSHFHAKNAVHRRIRSQHEDEFGLDRGETALDHRECPPMVIRALHAVLEDRPDQAILAQLVDPRVRDLADLPARDR